MNRPVPGSSPRITTIKAQTANMILSKSDCCWFESNPPLPHRGVTQLVEYQTFLEPCFFKKTLDKLIVI